MKIEIPRRNPNCATCSEHLSPGAQYVSELQLINEQMTRGDFCIPCWKNQKKEGWTFWKGNVPKREETKKIDVAKEEKALLLLQEAVANGRAEEAFVLALYLTRKKKLALRKEVNQTLLYEVLETEEMFKLQKPALSQLKVEELQSTIASKLT